ncbi:MmgE/PrpD family protein [Novosphingobium sp.]|uniref:MmgE/PrpD family protein n=1 Tax=Novosphingobium sp. TaxID=1874826 RepID=UPI00261F7B40|nr:MmgE/PrpD family protein [Novosphingobium sp.]
MLDRRLFMAGTLSAGLLTRMSAQAEPAMASEDAILPLARHMLQARFEDLPTAALTTTRAQLRDAVGVALAGRNEDGVRQLRELAADIGGKGESVVWGSALRLPSHDAARINATMVHALEYDDTFGPGFLHPSAIIFPAALAAADMAGGVSGRELLTAVTLANDIACRLSISGQPGVDGFAIGWHNTTLIGYVASALVAGRLLRLDMDQLVNAAGIAAHQAAGNAQSHIDSALTKRIGPGFASSAGVMAARLAARGVSGPKGVLEGRKGWFAQYHKGTYSRDLLLAGLGRDYPGAAMSFKPWPSCRGSHTSADAALQIAAALGGRGTSIGQIVIRNGPAEWGFLSAPIERKRQPATTVEAQFSIPWVVAAALADGKLSIAHFTPEALRRADLLAMAARIETVEEAALANPAGGPGQAIVEVTLTDGRVLKRHVVAAKGDPDVPMSGREVTGKLADCLDYAGLAPARQAHLLKLLDAVDDLPDVSRLTATMA